MDASYYFFGGLVGLLFSMVLGYLVVARIMKRKMASRPASGAAHGAGAAASGHDHAHYTDPWYITGANTLVLYFGGWGLFLMGLVWLFHALENNSMSAPDPIYLMHRFLSCGALYVWMLAYWGSHYVHDQGTKSRLFVLLFVSALVIGYYLLTGYDWASWFFEPISQFPGGDIMFPSEYRCSYRSPCSP